MADPGAFTLEPYDELFSMWVDLAPRFGAVAAHFPVSRWAAGEGGDCERVRTPWSGFVASFWALEVFFDGGDGRCWYGRGGTRPGLDLCCSSSIFYARSAGKVKQLPWLDPKTVVGDTTARRAQVPLGGDHAWTWQNVDTGKPRFWGPELPEVELVPQVHVPETVIYVRCADRGGRQWLHPVAWFASLLLLLVLALPAGAQTLPPGGTDGPAAPPPAIKGTARVVDGDTLEVAGEKVRLHGVDAPELAQTCQRANGAAWHCGWAAALRLEELIGGRPVRCLGAKRDRYQRLIARCYVVGERGPALDLGGALVVRGLAVAYRKYSLDYAGAEATARAARAGMWAGSFQQPEEWRKGVR